LWYGQLLKGVLNFMATPYQGYIRLYRQLQEKKWWSKERFTRGQAWVDILFTASHKNTSLIIDDNYYNVPLGSFVTSQRKLSRKWRWSISTVNAFLNFLQKTEQSIEYKTEHNFTHIYIRNWQKYQGKTEHKKEHKVEHESNTSRTRVEHESKQNNNVKECNNNVRKNDKEYIIKDDIGRVICAYKMLKGFKKQDREWDKLNYRRASRSAKQLLKAFKNNWEETVDYMIAEKKILEERGLEYTIETFVKRVSDYKLKKLREEQENV